MIEVLHIFANLAALAFVVSSMLVLRLSLTTIIIIGAVLVLVLIEAGRKPG